MKRITHEQIASAKQYWRDGWSIPECCQMTNMSRASFMKYCGMDVRTFIDEHTANKERREQSDRIAEIMPVTPNGVSIDTDDVIIDDGTVESLYERDDNQIMLRVQQEQDRQAAIELDQQMSDEAFMSLLHYEFSQCGNFEEAKATYYDYKPQAIINIMRVEYFRKVYEETLIRVTSKSDDKHNDVHEQTSNDARDNADKLVVNIVNLDDDKNNISNADFIKQLRDQHNVKIPVNKQCESWDEMRLLEHCCYHIYKHRHSCGHKQALGYVTNLNLNQRKRYAQNVD